MLFDHFEVAQVVVDGDARVVDEDIKRPDSGDCFLDLRPWGKGFVWVNGHNLGRYWYVGPQQHLYCPASWLKKGVNEICVLDLLQSTPAPIKGVRTLE